jgi:hypothetical protein
MYKKLPLMRYQGYSQFWQVFLDGSVVGFVKVNCGTIWTCVGFIIYRRLDSKQNIHQMRRSLVYLPHVTCLHRRHFHTWHIVLIHDLLQKWGVKSHVTPSNHFNWIQVVQCGFEVLVANLANITLTMDKSGSGVSPTGMVSSSLTSNRGFYYSNG